MFLVELIASWFLDLISKQAKFAGRCKRVLVSPGSSLCCLSISSGVWSPSFKLSVAVVKGSGSSVSAKIPRTSGAGVHKAGSSLTAGLSAGLRKTAQDWSVLSKRHQ